MKTLILPLLFLCTTFAHAEDWKNPEAPFSTAKNTSVSKQISWNPVSDIQKTCEQEYVKRGYGKLTWKVDACSFWRGNTCDIYTKANPTMHDIGHEMRHCYQGNYH